MRCDSFVLGGLLGSLSLLVLGGLGALLIGRMSSRSAVRLGTGTANAGVWWAACDVDLLVARADVVWTMPWRMPYGSLHIGVDSLSAFFLIPMFLLAGLGAIYSVGYFGSWTIATGALWLGYHVLVAGMIFGDAGAQRVFIFGGLGNHVGGLVFSSDL